MKISIRIDNRIRIPTGALPLGMSRALTKSCEHENPEYAKRKKQGYSTFNIEPIVRTWASHFAGSELSLPRGAMGRVRDIFRKYGMPYAVKDERIQGAPPRALTYVGHKPRVFQEEGCLAILAKEQGIIRAATGSGKTTTAIYTATRIGLNTLIVLPNVKLMKQTHAVACKLLGLRPEQVGIIRGNTKHLRPITVATQQTLWSRSIDADIRDFFGVVMVDEAHHSAARTFQEVIDQFPSRYRIALSADERRKDRKEFLVYDAFGSILHETTREQCEASGAIVDVEVRVVLSDADVGWYKRNSDFKRLLDELTADRKRNRLILDIVRSEVEAGEQIIICTDRREHARELDSSIIAMGFKSGAMLGRKVAADEEEFETTREALIERTVHAGVGTYQALGEGIDLPAVAAGIASTPVTSNKSKFNQFRGRLCRSADGKSHGRMYVILDRKAFDERALANILSWNRTVTVRRNGKWVDAKKLNRRAIMAG